MAITTVDGIISGLQVPVHVIKVSMNSTPPRMYSTFGFGAVPAAGVIAAGTAINGIALTGFTGQIPFTNPTTGNTYLARWEAAGNSGMVGTLYLCDRLWHNSATTVTSTAAQTVNSPVFPSRDLTGGTSGYGIMIGVEITSNMGAGTPTFSLNYTNHLGLTATTTTAAQPTGMQVGTFVPIQLAEGGEGVMSVNWWQQSATMTSGAYSLVAYRVIAILDVTQIGKTEIADAIQLGLPILYDNSCLFFLYKSNASTGGGVSFNSMLTFTQG